MFFRSKLELKTNFYFIIILIKRIFDSKYLRIENMDIFRMFNNNFHDLMKISFKSL